MVYFKIKSGDITYSVERELMPWICNCGCIVMLSMKKYHNGLICYDGSQITERQKKVVINYSENK